MNKFVFFLLGSTGIGKTFYSIKLGIKHPIEIINVDSIMIYRGLNIGTGKPMRNLMLKVPHYLIDIKNSFQNYSVFDFCIDCINIMENIFSRGKIPFFVGGTMMYVFFLQNGLSYLPNFNNYLKKNICKYNFNIFYDLLVYNDFKSLIKLHPNDFYRIGKIFNYFGFLDVKYNFFNYCNEKTFLKNINIFNIYLFNSDKLKFKKCLENRLFFMLKNFFLSEVNFLYRNVLLSNRENLYKIIGYKEVLMYLNMNISFKEMFKNIINNTTLLSKKQQSWIRLFHNVRYFDVSNTFFLKNFYLFFKRYF